jgi:Uma2 family endonuclease
MTRTDRSPPFSPDVQVALVLDYATRLRLDARWETNAQGRILVYLPDGLLHGKRAARIANGVRRVSPHWPIWNGVGLHTADGVKAPDLLAASPSFAEQVDSRGFLLAAPDLCIEFMSPSNGWEEMRQKALLYLAAGAKEAWVCDEGGELHFFAGSGETPESALVPGMVKRVDGPWPRLSATAYSMRLIRSFDDRPTGTRRGIPCAERRSDWPPNLDHVHRSRCPTADRETRRRPGSTALRGSCRPRLPRHGIGISRSRQILRARKSLISRWRGTVEHLPEVRFT